MPDEAAPPYAGERQLMVLAPVESLWGGANISTLAIGADRGVLPPMAQPTISSILKRYNATITPLFAPAPKERPIGPELRAHVATAIPGSTDMTQLYHRVIAKDSELDEIANALRSAPTVKAAYVKPRAEPAINRMQPSAAAPAPPAAQTPDFSSRQIHLGPAPAGIDAYYAWTLPGGAGAGVNIIDVEGEWRFDHEDLKLNSRGLLGGTPPNDIGWRNHGTAVVGVCTGNRNSFGVTGICHKGTVGMVSIFGAANRTSSTAIREAANLLSAGDILLIELHYPGPKNNFQNRNDQDGYIAVEWWPDEFDAIVYAVGRGIIVVEAAGNGAQDLDDALYETPDPGFQNGWKNPFRRANRDSGAILVGAGAPPPGTHNRNLYGPDRSRLDFSNFGSAVDVQGWGREVTTCGYGDLQSGSEDRWYTDEFAGTSSASPTVVGAIACLQGFLRASSAALLTPAGARSLLRSTGSPQQDAPGRPATQRIGNRPDLRALLGAVRTS
jgi:Subtilase family